MSSPDPDQVRLRHMLDAARDALNFSDGKSPEDLAGNRMLALAIVKSIQIIGEAAAHVTQETRKTYPGIPWTDIVGMRNRLVHSYYEIDFDIVWKTVIEDLPVLLRSLPESGLGRRFDNSNTTPK